MPINDLTRDEIVSMYQMLVKTTEALKLLRKGKMRPKDELLGDIIGECVTLLEAMKPKLQRKG
jgi:hypothetical protein